MECKVFGNPITEETLKGMPEYANNATITQADMAQVALSKKNTVKAQVQEYIEKLLKQVGSDMVYTHGKIYNATRKTVTFYTKHDYSGTGGFPEEIENGQVGVFKHVGSKDNGSCGAVVYYGENKSGVDRDWMLSWSNPFGGDDNKVYTEIAEHGHYRPKPFNPIWIYIHAKLKESGQISKYSWNGCESIMMSTRISESVVSVGAKMTVK